MTNRRAYRRYEAAKFLQAFGLKTTTASLATMATRGGGPPYFKNGKLCMYRRSDLEAWLEQRCTGLFDSTSSLESEVAVSIINHDADLPDTMVTTGDSGFDEITRILAEADEFRNSMDLASRQYDQQFT